jgi:hypothetical protein
MFTGYVNNKIQQDEGIHIESLETQELDQESIQRPHLPYI